MPPIYQPTLDICRLVREHCVLHQTNLPLSISRNPEYSSIDSQNLHLFLRSRQWIFFSVELNGHNQEDPKRRDDNLSIVLVGSQSVAWNHSNMIHRILKYWKSSNIYIITTRSTWHANNSSCCTQIRCWPNVIYIQSIPNVHFLLSYQQVPLIWTIS